ncbi:hypothetical protein Tco_0133806 [Tanacetum coccineum]
MSTLLRNYREVQMEDVEMHEDYKIDHSNTEEALQWTLAKDPFLVCMELNDQEFFLQRITLSSISNEFSSSYYRLMHMEWCLVDSWLQEGISNPDKLDTMPKMMMGYL